MDRHTLLVIIVTVAVTATVTTVVGWVLNFFKLQIANTLITKARTNAGKIVLKLIVYVFILAYNIWELMRRLNAPGSPTRYDVLWIVLDMFGVGVWIIAVMGVFIKMAFNKRMDEYKAAHSSKG